MTRTSTLLAAILAFAGILAASAINAQTAADELPDDLLACADETDVLERLACYDREIAKLRETPASPPPEENVAVDLGTDDNESPPIEFSAEVLEILHRPRGEMIIRLDNGEIWEQKHTGTRFRLSVGDTATLRKGAFGGYRLFGEGNRSIQVERIK